MMEGAMSKFKAEVQSSQVYDPSVEYPEPLSPLVLVMSHSFDRPQVPFNFIVEQKIMTICTF